MSSNDFNTVFSRQLKHYLSLNNMTQNELARKLRVGNTSVYNWCNGIKSPRMDKVDAMCSIFGCRRSDLMEDHTPLNPPVPDYTTSATPEEFESLVKPYRSLDPYGRETVDYILSREAERSQKLRQHADRFSALESCHTAPCASTPYREESKSIQGEAEIDKELASYRSELEQEASQAGKSPALPDTAEKRMA